MRALLKQRTGREVPPAPVCDVGPEKSLPVLGHDVRTQPRPSFRSGANRGDAADGGAITVRAELPTGVSGVTAPGVSTGFARHGLACIVWEGERSGSRAVPKSVARAFGKAERSFASFAALERYLADLYAQTAFNRVVDAVKAQERPAAQLRQRLVREGFTEEAAAQAVARAERCGLVDDRRFAEAFTAAKLRAGWGAQRVRRELARDGVELPVGEGGDRPELDCSVDAERIRAWKAVARRSVPDKHSVEKLARFLVGRGFSTSVAFETARRRVAESQQGGCALVDNDM